MTKEMYAANVKNWLMDLATGAKAMQKVMQFAPAEKGLEWKVTTSCYDQFEDGIPVHNLKNLAEVIDVSIKYNAFTSDQYLYGKYPGYYYIELFGTRFYDLTEEEEDERK